MLNIHNLSVSFQGEDLFKEITFRLGAGNRAGLIGKNGAGKSTLLKIISGDQEHDSGQIALGKDVNIGFLRQDIDFVAGRNVLEESYQAFKKIKEIEFQMEELNLELTTRTDYESSEYSKIIEDVTELQHQYEIHGGYNYQGETERILLGLGFQREDFEKLQKLFLEVGVCVLS